MGNILVYSSIPQLELCTVHYMKTEVPAYTCYVCSRVLTDDATQYMVFSNNTLRNFCSKSCLDMWTDAVTTAEGDAP